MISIATSVSGCLVSAFTKAAQTREALVFNFQHCMSLPLTYARGTHT